MFDLFSLINLFLVKQQMFSLKLYRITTLILYISASCFKIAFRLLPFSHPKCMDSSLILFSLLWHLHRTVNNNYSALCVFLQFSFNVECSTNFAKRIKILGRQTISSKHSEFLLFVDRSGRSLQFFHLKFNKEAISDGIAGVKRTGIGGGF